MSSVANCGWLFYFCSCASSPAARPDWSPASRSPLLSLRGSRVLFYCFLHTQGPAQDCFNVQRQDLIRFFIHHICLLSVGMLFKEKQVLSGLVSCITSMTHTNFCFNQHQEWRWCAQLSKQWKWMWLSYGTCEICEVCLTALQQEMIMFTHKTSPFGKLSYIAIAYHNCHCFTSIMLTHTGMLTRTHTHTQRKTSSNVSRPGFYFMSWSFPVPLTHIIIVSKLKQYWMKKIKLPSSYRNFLPYKLDNLDESAVVRPCVCAQSLGPSKFPPKLAFLTHVVPSQTLPLRKFWETQVRPTRGEERRHYWARGLRRAPPLPFTLYVRVREPEQDRIFSGTAGWGSGKDLI